MESENRDSDEARIVELFEASADEPSAAQLTKLAARATEIPDAVARRSRWLSPWLWAPGVAALAAVAALWVTTERPSPHDPGSATAMAQSSRPVATATASVAHLIESATPAPSVPPDQQPNVSDDDDNVDEPPIVALAGLEGGQWDELSELDALYGPPPDADLDAWLAATAALLED